MVKKKSVATKKVVGKKAVGTKVKAGTKSVRKTRWYIWVLIGLLFVIIGNQVYKYVATRQDVALLDSAEEKMRQLDFPGGEKGIIERYCSEKSVKFGSPGKPACGVGYRLELDYKDSQEIEDQTAVFLDALENQSITSLERRTDGINHYYSIGGVSESLDCSLSNVIISDDKDKSLNHVLYLYCQKDFQSKLYPIRD